MRTKHRVLVGVAAISSICLAPLANAAAPFGAGAALPPGGIPVTITGRIVTEEGQPVAGVEMWSPPRSGSGGGILSGLPQIVLFEGVPPSCLGQEPGSGRIVTDSQGRYRYTLRFYPDNEVGGRKCSEHRSRFRTENVGLVPMPSGQYEFRRATGPLPLPTPRANLPAGAIAPQKAQPKGGFDASTIRR